MKKKLLNFLFVKPLILKYKILSTCKRVIGKAKLVQATQLNGRGSIIFGKKVQIGYEPSPFLYNGYSYLEARNEKAKIIIGNNVVFNNNIVIISEWAGIAIESDVLIGTNCEIIDSDFHNLDISNRKSASATSQKVKIESNVFIGNNVKILKGVTIGKNSVIANGSIVTKSIPENVIAGGIPAKVIKKIKGQTND